MANNTEYKNVGFKIPRELDEKISEFCKKNGYIKHIWYSRAVERAYNQLGPK